MFEKINKFNRSFDIKKISYLLTASFLLNSCNPIVKTLGPFSSNSVLESKKNGTFLWKYEPINVVINDTIQIQSKEIFAERSFYHNSYDDLTYKVSDRYSQINIILLKPLSCNKSFGVWQIVNFEHPNDYTFINDFDSQYPPNSLVVKVLTENLSDVNYKPKLLGTFVLRKIINKPNR